MTPELAVGDVLSDVWREIERNAFRARNGIKYVAGAQWAPVGPTPSDDVWQQGKATLRRYRRDTPARLGPPVIAFLGLVSRAYVLDLWKGNSFVGRLMEAGFETFVLDWGEPDEEDAGNTLETYVDAYLPRAIEALRRETGSDEVNLIGYCMGGDLALMALAGRPDLPVRNLVTMATPVDFRHMGPLAGAVRDGRIDIEDVIDESGNVPADLIENFFRIRKPTADLVQYANLWQNMWNDEYMEGYQAMGQWTRDHVPFPGAAFRQTVEQLVRRNALMEGSLELGGERVDLGAIRCPLLNVVAERDHIVPLPAAEPVPRLVGSEEAEELRLAAGHVGLVAGRAAAKVTLPGIAGWIADHSEPV